MSFLDDLIEVTGALEAVGSKVEETKDGVLGFAFKLHDEKKKADALREVIDRTNELGQNDQKPSPLGIAYEVGRFLWKR